MTAKRSYKSKKINFFFGRRGCGWVGWDTAEIFLFELKYVMFFLKKKQALIDLFID